MQGNRILQQLFVVALLWNVSLPLIQGAFRISTALQLSIFEITIVWYFCRLLFLYLIYIPHPLRDQLQDCCI